jgi:hypothetical protein
MKKIIVFLLLVFVVGLGLDMQGVQKNLFLLFNDYKCELFVKANSGKSVPSFASVANSGAYMFVGAESALGGYLVNYFGSDVIGITVFTYEPLEQVLIKLQAKIASSEQIENTTHYFGFSPLFNNFIITKNKKTNVHIVVQENQIVIGVPVIYGSY